MKILFISHSYPPTLGGVESQNFNLAHELKNHAKVKIIANGKGKIYLPIFLPLAFIQALFLMTTYDACLLGNGVLAPLGAVLKFFHPRKKFFCVVHGLDITFIYKDGLLPKIYGKVNLPSLGRLDKLFMVGNTTVDEAIKAGLPVELCVFIPNGVNARQLRKKHSRDELSKIFGSNTKDKKVILRLGRFVPHKGTGWFIENIMPKLSENIVMIAVGHRVGKNTAGDRDDFLDCEKAIINNKLEKRVKLAPSLPQKDLEVLLNTVDMVVAPNVKIPGSMEGFGINVIEAGACERLVLASNLEGLADAVANGKNGFLVEPENTDKWIKKISAIFDAGEDFITGFGKRAGRYVEENYSWEKISKKYLEEMEK